MKVAAEDICTGKRQHEPGLQLFDDSLHMHEIAKKHAPVLREFLVIRQVVEAARIGTCRIVVQHGERDLAVALPQHARGPDRQHIVIGIEGTDTLAGKVESRVDQVADRCLVKCVLRKRCMHGQLELTKPDRLLVTDPDQVRKADRRQLLDQEIRRMIENDERQALVKIEMPLIKMVGMQVRHIDGIDILQVGQLRLQLGIVTPASVKGPIDDPRIAQDPRSLAAPEYAAGIADEREVQRTGRCVSAGNGIRHDSQSS